MEINQKEIQLITEDQFTLSAHVFAPESTNQKLLLINSATGVKQEFYFHFAEYLAHSGFIVITYDYRGVGRSKPKQMKGFEATMRDWGKWDYKCLAAYVKENYPNQEKYLLGHSIGALILGLTEDSSIFKKCIFVSTQSSYFRRLNFKTQLSGVFGFGLLMPLVSFAYGYFPANYFGLGESLPKGAAKDWRKMVLHPDSINYLLEQEEDTSDLLTQEVLVIRSEDDDWLTEAGEKELFASTYVNMKPTFRLLDPKTSPKGEIGHVNFFRQYNKTLWDIVLVFLNKC